MLEGPQAGGAWQRQRRACTNSRGSPPAWLHPSRLTCCVAATRACHSADLASLRWSERNASRAAALAASACACAVRAAMKAASAAGIWPWTSTVHAASAASGSPAIRSACTSATSAATAAFVRAPPTPLPPPWVAAAPGLRLPRFASVRPDLRLGRPLWCSELPWLRSGLAPSRRCSCCAAAASTSIVMEIGD